MMDIAQTPKPENPLIKDRIVHDLPAKLGFAEGMAPSERFARILGMGAKIRKVENHVYPRVDELMPEMAPQKLSDGREYLFLGGNAATPRMALEAARFAVDNALAIIEYRATTPEDGIQYMLPYPHIEEPDKIVGGSEASKEAGVASVDLLVINGKQMAALQEILKKKALEAQAGTSTATQSSAA